MENPAGLIQRLLDIQIDGQPRSPELIAEDEQLIERLRSQVERSTQTGTPGSDYHHKNRA